MNRRNIILFISLLHVALFVYASVTKLGDYANFRFGLSESPFIHPFAGILAWAVPGVELAIVVLLVLPATRMAGLYASFFLMLLFTVYISVMLLSASEIPCSCGGILEEMSWPVHIVFNSVFVLLSAIAIFLLRQGKLAGSKPLTINHINNLSYAKGNSESAGAYRSPDTH